MSATDPLSYVPAQIEAGNSTSFLLSYADFAPGTWTLDFIMADGVSPPKTTRATTSGTSFLVTLTTAITAPLAAGEYQWKARVQTSSETRTAAMGAITILPNLANGPAPSHAAQMVTKLEAKLLEYAENERSMQRFDLTESRRAMMVEYQKQLTYWKAQVIGEARRAACQRGDAPARSIGPQFVTQ